MNEKESAGHAQADFGKPDDSVRSHPARFRFIRAFTVTLLIALNISVFHLLGKFFGSEWENNKAGGLAGTKIKKAPVAFIAGIFIRQTN